MEILKNKIIIAGIILAVILVSVQIIDYKIDKINEENMDNLLKANAVTAYSLDAKIKANGALIRYILNKEYNITDISQQDRNDAMSYLQKQFEGETYRTLIESGQFIYLNVSEDKNIILIDSMLDKEDLFGNGSTIPYYYSKELSGALNFYELRDIVYKANNPKSDSGWKLFRNLLIAFGLIINIYILTRKRE